MSEIVRRVEDFLPQTVRISPTRAREIFAAWSAGKSQTTLRAYAQDIDALATHLACPAPVDALVRLLSGTQGAANEILFLWRGAMIAAELAPSTVNRRLAAARSFAAVAKQLGVIDWTVSVPSVKSRDYRDTRGPGVDGVAALIEQALKQKAPKAARDVAIIRLLYDRALRRAEVCALRLEDVDIDGARLAILGKGRLEREWVTIGERTMRAITDWLRFRGRDDGPLFYRVDNARSGDRVKPMTGSAIYALISELGNRAGIKARPHGLRHAGITRALDITAGNYREVRQFSRHAKVETLLKYDDNREDKGGDIAAKLSGEL